MTPITRNPAGVDGMVRSAHLPTVKTLTLRTEFERQGLSADQAFSNSLKLDLTKDFFPFGEKPKFGDTFYLASEEIFSNPDAMTKRSKSSIALSRYIRISLSRSRDCVPHILQWVNQNSLSLLAGKRSI